jgi:mRNA-degrading endonuclease RelE of RelBE toxin-antitoxin system
LYFSEKALVPAVGARLVEKIKIEGDALEYLPHCPVYDKKRGLRRKIVGNYLIYFTVDEKKEIVLITQVVDGRRNLTQVLR